MISNCSYGRIAGAFWHPEINSAIPLEDDDDRWEWRFIRMTDCQGREIRGKQYAIGLKEEDL